MAITYSSEAIVLGKRNYGEADKIISVFSKHKGKIFLMAKSARKPSSRKRGHLEVFNVIRFSAIETKSLDIFSEAQVTESFEEIKKDLKKTSVAYFFLEVIGKLTRENEPHEDIYYILFNSLNNLITSSNLKQLRKQYIRDILVTLGFWPQNLALDNPDKVLEDIAERQFSSIRVGKKVLE
ncbi:MAG: repair protein RecO protein [Candidatus Woesebacteria bacterium GW2011_GWB1_38_5b]|uniref:Repair protein RecO protein n=1 Tax=Candidatus Woesebacteria bacterium GW2011_GWB1_38_5b TaxID=1618569 RepID=A0A0G0K9Y9_9BACT|nr:MAG: repair protein RecO protein [Candidatus Woesebacteria bacterium GW2011_GWB1_38_5b]